MIETLARTMDMLAAASPAWMAVTVGAYVLAMWVHRLSRSHPLTNPVPVAVAVVIAAVLIAGIDYDTYFAGASAIHFVLGPATVALAVPLYQHLPAIGRDAKPLLIALLAGSVTAGGLAVLIAWAMGATPHVIAAMATKSVTTPITIGIAEEIGASVPLAVAFVMITGISTVLYAAPLMRRLGLVGAKGQGLAIGTVSHGIGTARAFQLGETSGTYAGLAMGINGVLSAFLIPLIAWALG